MERVKSKSAVVADSVNHSGQVFYRVVYYTAYRGKWLRVGQSGPIPRYLYYTCAKLQDLPWGCLDGKPAE